MTLLCERASSAWNGPALIQRALTATIASGDSLARRSPAAVTASIISVKSPRCSSMSIVGTLGRSRARVVSMEHGRSPSGWGASNAPATTMRSTFEVDYAARMTDWESRYAEPGYAFGTKPNDFLRERVDALPPGPILCLAEGEGRNAVWLAQRGYDVTAVDLSSRGLQKAQRLASDRRVKIKTIEADLA